MTKPRVDTDIINHVDVMLAEARRRHARLADPYKKMVSAERVEKLLEWRHNLANAHLAGLKL